MKGKNIWSKFIIFECRWICKSFWCIYLVYQSTFGYKHLSMCKQSLLFIAWMWQNQWTVHTHWLTKGCGCFCFAQLFVQLVSFVFIHLLFKMQISVTENTLLNISLIKTSLTDVFHLWYSIDKLMNLSVSAFWIIYQHSTLSLF